MLIGVYYSFWAQIRDIPLFWRSIIVVGVFTCIIYLVVKVINLKPFCLIFKICNFFLLISYFIVEKSFFHLRQEVRSIESWNRIADSFNEKSLFLTQKGRCFWNKKILKLKSYCILGFIFMVSLISLPEGLKNILSSQYLNKISVVRNLYLSFEEDQIIHSKGYHPFFARDEKKKEIKLVLTKKGIDGANIRKKANRRSRIVDVVSGNDKLIYLKEKHGWIKIKMKNGKVGWIRKYLVKKLD
ncbi:SH3 domain-containing protein [Anaerostipes caccae]|uniref:SH3 domain-containing protein n=1 Tax=Anaerostipes caccae TaxID=105841 RepID=UPI0038D3A052